MATVMSTFILSLLEEKTWLVQHPAPWPEGTTSTASSLYLLKSLSTSYSYLIHVFLYTKNSRKARTAMRVNAIRDTEGGERERTNKSHRHVWRESVARQHRLSEVCVCVLLMWPWSPWLRYLSHRWLWTPRSSRELWGKRPTPSPESEPFSWSASSWWQRRGRSVRWRHLIKWTFPRSWSPLVGFFSFKQMCNVPLVYAEFWSVLTLNMTAASNRASSWRWLVQLNGQPAKRHYRRLAWVTSSLLYRRRLKCLFCNVKPQRLTRRDAG